MRVGGALRVAAGEARGAWRPRAWIAALAVVLVAIAPATVLDAGGVQDGANAFYVVLAAIGLNVALGLGGMPSLGQGAFVAVGAFGAALLRARLGWDPLSATLAGTAMA